MTPSDPLAPTSEQIEARLETLYGETGAVVRAFWEWRHKVMLICSAMLAFVFATASWMYKQRLGGVPMVFPLSMGAGVAWMCLRMDRRNGQIINNCYDAAIALESQLMDIRQQPGDRLQLEPGIYWRLVDKRGRVGDDEVSPSAPPPPARDPLTGLLTPPPLGNPFAHGTYGHTLRRVYTVLMWAFLAGAVVVGIGRIWDDQWLVAKRTATPTPQTQYVVTSPP